MKKIILISISVVVLLVLNLVFFLAIMPGINGGVINNNENENKTDGDPDY